MFFHSSVRKELSRSFGATLIVLITVVMTMTLIRTLGQATRGSFAPQDIMLAMGFALLADMPSILSLSLTPVINVNQPAPTQPHLFAHQSTT